MYVYVPVVLPAMLVHVKLSGEDCHCNDMPVAEDSPLKERITVLPFPGQTCGVDAETEPAVGVPLQSCAYSPPHALAAIIKSNKKNLLYVENFLIIRLSCFGFQCQHLLHRVKKMHGAFCLAVQFITGY